jgi:peptidoglycan/LPS O-acetylase OafA/YrhL
MASASPSATIPSIQYLRAFAALMVVSLHLQLQRERLGAPELDLAILATGVNIFFVISGFIMWVTTATRPQRTAAEFMRDRLIRIVPIYWIVTLLMLVVLLVDPGLAQTAILEPGHVISSFLFLPSPNPAGGTYTPLLIPGWSLNYEMVFYLLFAVAIWRAGHSLKLRAGLILAVLIGFAAVGYAFRPSGILGFYTSDIILHFGFGMLIGMVYLSGLVPRSNRWWLLTGAGVLLLAAVPVASRQLGALAIFAATTAIVFGAAFAGEHKVNLPLLKIGDWSYSLYLTHPLVLSALCQGWALSGTKLPLALFGLLGVSLCIATAAASFIFLEQPITRKAKSWLRTRPAPQLEAATVPAVAPHSCGHSLPD